MAVIADCHHLLALEQLNNNIDDITKLLLQSETMFIYANWLLIERKRSLFLD